MSDSTKTHNRIYAPQYHDDARDTVCIICEQSPCVCLRPFGHDIITGTEDTMRTTCFTCGEPTETFYGHDLYGGGDCQCYECYMEEVEYRAQERHREHMNSMAGVGTMGSDTPLHCRMNKPL